MPGTRHQGRLDLIAADDRPVDAEPDVAAGLERNRAPEAGAKATGHRRFHCELAMETPMACGFGACFGCAIPLKPGGYIRLCVDGPVIRGDQIETALVPGSGH